MISSFSLITLVLFLSLLPRYAKNYLPSSYHFGGVAASIFKQVPFHRSMQGEELRKLIGAAAYIECSSKTQQVVQFFSFPAEDASLSSLAVHAY